jgi:hypothetical protein
MSCLSTMTRDSMAFLDDISIDLSTRSYVEQCMHCARLSRIIHIVCWYFVANDFALFLTMKHQDWIDMLKSSYWDTRRTWIKCNVFNRLQLDNSLQTNNWYRLLSITRNVTNPFIVTVQSRQSKRSSRIIAFYVTVESSAYFLTSFSIKIKLLSLFKCKQLQQPSSNRRTYSMTILALCFR